MAVSAVVLEEVGFKNYPTEWLIIDSIFCKKIHYNKWAATRSVNTDEVFCLDAHEALIVARMLFKLT